MPFAYILYSAWRWLLDPGISLAIYLVIAFLIPRIGRFAIRFFTRRVDLDEQDSKTRLALVGTAVYMAQLVAYFFLIVAVLNSLGVPLAGAAIPATVISAAVGLGAQSIIADFLAGFFILSEKQFGVGDWVAFQGPGVNIEGDVIQITMRATKVRTLQGETVIIPNSTARVCVNHSNIWARAVVIIPVPLLGSTSIHEAISRSERAARRALARPDIAPDVTGELDVHPAVGISQPTTVGMPWLVEMRFIVQVNPARQWAVERAIRTCILDEFWEEYGSATTTSGAVRNKLEREAPVVLERVFTKEPKIDVPIPSPDTATFSAPKRNKEASRDDISVENPENAPIDEQESMEPEGVFRTVTYPSRFARFFSFGGRVRPSTTGLFAILFGLFILKGFTVEAGEEWEDSRGWLAPTAATKTTTTPKTSETPTSEESTVTQETPTTIVSTTPTPTTASVTPTEPSTPATSVVPETSTSVDVPEPPSTVEVTTPPQEQPSVDTPTVQPEN
ncbi:mechanosensitive ion channel family protein [Corynebacterium freiburgense]|uniref:mechanosensitive ion channel family protein n=1 Tax=Corynebacterium freiburgense TaxID=556548 RepID=UPI000411B702|nr:mechanosensitive ion channel family protein [Corynebacterium freiburgense]WJZ02437.1 putative MscS family protein YkuT [Corynebacterium freiburgense]